MKENQNLYQHFRADEQAFIDQVLDWKQRVEETYIPFVSPFLDPREQHIVSQLLPQKEVVKLYFSGGFDSSERQRALLTVADQVEPSDFQISLLQINYPKKFASLEHHRILGSLLSTGLKRSLVGDIVRQDQEWYIILDATMASYVKNQLTKIGPLSVHLDFADFSSVRPESEAYLTSVETLSSFRLDNVIAHAYKLSRKIAKELVEQGMVKLNWKEEERPTVEVSQKDTISVRRYGRIQLDQILGQTKNRKWRVQLLILKNKKKS